MIIKTKVSLMEQTANGNGYGLAQFGSVCFALLRKINDNGEIGDF